jgi:hypothetical protein
MLHGSHMGPPPVMPWGGSPIAEEPLTWPPPLGGYWTPPPSSGYWPPLPPAGHPGQSSSTPHPLSGYGYWPLPPWAPPNGGQVLSWGMPPWMTQTPQPQRHSSSPQTVSHSCLLSIVPFTIWTNVECLTYSSISIFKCPSSSVGHEFMDGALNMGGPVRVRVVATTLWRRDRVVLHMWCICVVKWHLCIVVNTMDYCCDICIVSWSGYGVKWARIGSSHP